MRRPLLLVTMLGAAAVAAWSASRAQEEGLPAYYWPHRTVGIPVNVEQLQRLPQPPTQLQLYYAVQRGTFQKGPRLPVTHLQALDGGKRGFLFTAERDGDYEFTVQFVYADGSVSPRLEELAPQQRIIIDTTPPLVRLVAIGTGVEWQVSDEHLDPRGVQLQCRWPGTRDWTTVTDRAFRPTDRYQWQLPAGKTLEVRVVARDRAGNTGVSPIVRVPAEGAATAGLPRPGAPPDWLSGGRTLPAPRIDYVNTLKFDVEFTIQRMGPSGVKAAHLFVLKNTGGWEFAKKVDVHLRPGEKEPVLTIPYEAPGEGTYGFYIIPESGAGKRADDPQADDPPMLYVVVDTTPPYLKITGVQVRPGSRGPQVEITWECADPNLMPQPVSLEWSLDRSASRWNEIKYRLDNLPNSSVGRYVWEVPDQQLWKFWIRARAVDKAANTTEFVWPQEVIVDLEKPSATINKVRSSRPGGATGPDTPPPTLPQSPSEEPPPGARPTSVPPTSSTLPATPGVSGSSAIPSVPPKGTQMLPLPPAQPAPDAPAVAPPLPPNTSTPGSS
ncbi:MAG: hypothetical protein NZU63_00230 [Gemmataceae bacterium]|nr:hypothetical protein [Gemmataceae bacterium]MDW8241723.1 hypothetical protein [Thermogemmata sp.]